MFNQQKLLLSRQTFQRNESSSFAINKKEGLSYDCVQKFRDFSQKVKSFFNDISTYCWVDLSIQDSTVQHVFKGAKQATANGIKRGATHHCQSRGESQKEK